MSIKLFYSQYTRSTRPRWLLEELGVPYELFRLNMKNGEHKGPDYLKVHPHGVVPGMLVNEKPLMESLAMCMWLADTYSQGKLSPDLKDAKRADYIQWFFYATNTVEPHLVKYFEQSKKTETERNESEMKKAVDGFKSSATLLNEKLKNNSYILGDEFTAADVAIGSMMIWAGAMKLLGEYPHIVQYNSRLKDRPAYKKATAD